MRFYLGTHQVDWLWRLTDVPLFVSRRRLAVRRTPFPRATTPWALDSGGFTELSMHHEWRVEPERYVEQVRQFRDELGGMQWASPMDWMCEPWITAKTGRTVLEHQQLTVDNYLTLRALAPDLPFVPVLQGWQLDDYHRCADLYAAAGVDLTRVPVVGVGSVCRRQGEESIAVILQSLQERGLNLHGFGVKTQGLLLSVEFLTSADSLAWSFRARRDAADRRALGLPASRYGCRHGADGDGACANCPRFAVEWRTSLLEKSARPWRQQALSFG